MQGAMLALLAAVLIAIGVAYPYLRKRKAQASPEDAAPVRPRSIELGFAPDDLRVVHAAATQPAAHTKEELDPDEHDPFRQALAAGAPQPADVQPELEAPAVIEPVSSIEPIPDRELVREIVLAPEPETVPVAEQAFAVAMHAHALSTITRQPVPILRDEEDDGPVDFSGVGSLEAHERDRLLAEMEAHFQQNHAPPEHESAREIAVAQAETSVQEQPEVAAQGGDVVATHEWPTFMGTDAQSLGDAEREVLILMLRNMHDASWCPQILVRAFHEEQPEGLRPKVLEALSHSYHGPELEDLYRYCLDYGTPAEVQLAQDALAKLTGVQTPA